jgi:tetratricopeptide (TPR) repeat protein
MIPIIVGLTLLAAEAGAQGLSPDLARQAQAHYKEGVELMSAERWEAAAGKFQAAIDIDKVMAMAHYNLGQCRMQQRRFVEAVVAYQGARDAFASIGLLSQQERSARERARQDEINELKDSIQRFRTLKDASAQVALGMEERLRTLEAAQGRNLEENPVPAEIFLALGSAYFRQQKIEDAEREYGEAVRINRKLGAAHNNLAVIYLLTGRLDQAEESMKQAERNGFKVNPRFKDDLEAAKAKR